MRQPDKLQKTGQWTLRSIQSNISVTSEVRIEYNYSFRPRCNVFPKRIVHFAHLTYLWVGTKDLANDPHNVNTHVDRLVDIA